jgi:TolB-like protein/DNA-binding winged helix-turn-helix (wHTH) protein/tetratricopeptide (TPR) repeat protein
MSFVRTSGRCHESGTQEFSIFINVSKVLAVKALIQFAGYQLDPDARSLRRDNRPIALNPKTFDLLLYLVTHPHQVVTKDQLLTAVWPDSFVEESNLTQHVFLLRKAMATNQQADPIVVTIPGKGYQFTATVEPVPREGATRVGGEQMLESAQSETGMVVEGETDGESPVPAALPVPHQRRGRWFWAKVVATAGALAVVTAAGYFSYKEFGNAPSNSAVSIVVLPFINLTGDPSKEYLSDGVTEEMITGLARSEGGQLRVIARTSAMSYKSTNKTIRQIAQELGVQYVLEGSVQSEGDHLHVTAQLIRGDDQTHVWADTFDGDTGQILKFENHLTGSVAHSLSLTLLAGKTTEHIPVNNAAHDAYLQGLYYVAQRSRTGLNSALQSFGTAVAQDPQYARAYAELAITYNLMGQYSFMDATQAHSQAKAAALQAIAADPDLAEAHAALGLNKWFYEWNPAAAEKELLQAIQLEPTNVDARHWYALVLMTSGHLPDAEKQMRVALALDPKALILRTNLGWLHYMDRQYPRAIQEIQSVVNENPDFLTAHYKLWWAYSVTGDVPHAWKELDAIAHVIFTPDNEKGIVAVYERQGYAASLKAVTSSGDGTYLKSLVDDARCMSFAGDKAGALEFLDRALQDREGWMVFLESDPAFDSLRSDPKYSRLVQEVRSVSNSFQ